MFFLLLFVVDFFRCAKCTGYGYDGLAHIRIYTVAHTDYSQTKTLETENQPKVNIYSGVLSRQRLVRSTTTALDDDIYSTILSPNAQITLKLIGYTKCHQIAIGIKRQTFVSTYVIENPSISLPLLLLLLLLLLSIYIYCRHFLLPIVLSLTPHSVCSGDGEKEKRKITKIIIIKNGWFRLAFDTISLVNIRWKSRKCTSQRT